MNQEMIVKDTGEIIDLPPGKIVEKPQLEILSFDGMSTLKLTEKQITTLMGEIPKEDLDIKPTGEVYASQIRYRRILNAAFGPGGWGLRPISPIAVKDNTVYRDYALIVNGVVISTAVGGQEYFPTNRRLSYADAAEAAKSDALKRCCKDLGIASECWDRVFCEKFKKEFCVQEYGKWRRKDAEPIKQENQSTKEPEFEHDLSDQMATDKQVKMLVAIRLNRAIPLSVEEDYLQSKGKFTLSTLTSKEVNELKKVLEGWKK